MFEREQKLRKQNKCPFCKKKINLKDFKDELSKQEYLISGLCQKCQNQVFSEELEKQF